MGIKRDLDSAAFAGRLVVHHRALRSGLALGTLLIASGCATEVVVGENTPCDGGLLACPTSSRRPVCVDLATSPVHCGACGVGCPRGTCAEGRCCESFACGGRCFSARREVRRARVGVETVVVHPADFDADGRDDLFLSTNGESLVWLIWGRADGQLVDIDSYSWGKPGYWLGSGDLDGDGHLDALLLPDDERTGEHLELRVRFGDGRRRFERERRYPITGANPTFAAVYDVNGDGLSDVLLLSVRQRCVLLLRGLPGGALSDPRCAVRVDDATTDGPAFVSLGRDARGSSHWLSEGAIRRDGLRPLVRWVFARDGASLERVEPIDEESSRVMTRSSVVRAASGQRMAIRFEVDGTPSSRRAWIRGIQPDLSVTSCEQASLDPQTDGASSEYVLSAGDFDGDGRTDFFGLTSLCPGCPGMLYAHLGR